MLFWCYFLEGKLDVFILPPGLWLGLRIILAWDFPFQQQQIRKKTRQSKHWSCKPWLDHSLWVRWFPGSLWWPPIPNPVYSLPGASCGPLACWDEQESHRVPPQCSMSSTHPVAYWTNTMRSSQMKEIRLSHRLCRRFGHTVTLVLADLVIDILWKTFCLFFITCKQPSAPSFHIITERPSTPGCNPIIA